MKPNQETNKEQSLSMTKISVYFTIAILINSAIVVAHFYRIESAFLEINQSVNSGIPTLHVSRFSNYLYFCTVCNAYNNSINSYCKYCGSKDKQKSARWIIVKSNWGPDDYAHQFQDGSIHAMKDSYDKLPEKFTLKGSAIVYNKSQVKIAGIPNFEKQLINEKP